MAGRDTQPAIIGTLSRRFPPTLDNYLFVLASIILVFVLVGLLSDSAIGRAAGLAGMGMVFFLSLRASGVRLSTVRFAAEFGTPILAVVVAAVLTGSQSVVGTVASLFSALLVIACTVVITRRLAQHERISVSTVMGTLCIYLFIALLFAVVFVTISLLSGEPFFAQKTDPTAVDFIYYSVITISTTGYGDLSPLGNLGRMMAAVEVIVGQLFLVTVVALLVGNMGRRLWLGPNRPDAEPEAPTGKEGEHKDGTA
jgi:hypothetical protein